MSWAEMKTANSTIGTTGQKPLDKMVLDYIANMPRGEAKNVSLDFSAGNQVVYPSEKKVITKANLIKPIELKPSNIRKDVVIAGIKGTLEETYPFYDLSYTILPKGE